MEYKKINTIKKKCYLIYIYIDMLGFADDLDLSALTNDQIKGKKSVLTENAVKAGLRIYRGGGE